MKFLFSVNDSGIEQICYCNDELYELLGTPYLSEIFDTVEQLNNDISRMFGEGALWFTIPLPIHASNPQYSRIQQVFPVLRDITNNYSNPITTQVDDLVFYTYKWDAEYYAIDYSPSTVIGYDSIFSKSTHTPNSLQYTRIGIGVFRGSDIDTDNKKLKAGAVVRYMEIRIDKTNWQWWYGSFNETQYGNTRDWDIESIIGDTTDPYDPGGNTGDDGTGGTGGTGDFDGTSDSVDFPNLPNLSAVDTGFITLFNPSASQLKSLANYMWSGLFDLDTFKKIFADPMDCILGLSIVPVNVPSGSSDTVKVGNISTGVSMTKATSQYVAVDCGTLNVNEFWGAYLDYSPYTKAEIYLPYVGTHPLDIDDIMNKPVHVKYHIDILSGACIAFVKCGDSVLYSFIGQCSSSIPITGNDWTNVINGVINIAGAVGSMVMTGGMSAPMAIGQIASTAVNSSKPSVEKSGSLSGTGGMLGVQTPYIILTRPRQALPAQQNVYTGYPSFITRTLSSVSGYTEVDHIHLENVPGTESELSEIESLLKTGVIF